jgi:hypothetical protein
MKDKGLSSGLVQSIDTSKAQFKGFFGFRKMFWDYLNKLHVPFKDSCCADASGSDVEPIGWDESLGEIVRWNGTSWVPVLAFTTTTSSTTTSTTLASTTTTTT